MKRHYTRFRKWNYQSYIYFCYVQNNESIRESDFEAVPVPMCRKATYLLYYKVHMSYTTICIRLLNMRWQKIQILK